jgi:hypothetical protein
MTKFLYFWRGPLYIPLRMDSALRFNKSTKEKCWIKFVEYGFIFHRMDGPAIIYANGCKEYWIENKRMYPISSTNGLAYVTYKQLLDTNTTTKHLL